MAWTYGGVRLYVQEYEQDRENIIARIQPINANTILHHFGYGDRIIQLNAYVVTDADVATLDGFAKSSSAQTLVGPEGTIDDFFCKTCKPSREMIACSVWFDRPGLDDDVPVYTVALELYRDE